MKVLFLGSSSFNNTQAIHSFLNKCKSKITKLVTRKANGADVLAYEWAKENDIDIDNFKPEKYTKTSSVLLVNKAMIEEADCIFVFWDGASEGTQKTINYLRNIKKRFMTIIFDNKSNIVHKWWNS